MLAPLAWLFLSLLFLFAVPAHAQTSVTNRATIAPPASVVNSNPSASCTLAGVCEVEDTDTVTTSANLGITKTTSITAGTVGSTFSYVITFANAGPSAALTVTLTDSLSAAGLILISGAISVSSGSIGFTTSTTSITATTASLANGVSGTITLTVQVSSGSGSITNAAAITSTTPDPVTTNNTSTSTISRVSVVNLSPSKVVGSSTLAAGATTSFTLVVTNAGPSTLTGSLNDSITSAFTVTSVSSAVNGSASTSNFSVTGSGVFAGSVTIASGGTVTVTINVTALSTGNYTNTVTLVAPSGTGTGTATATAPGTVTAVSDVSVTLTVPASGTAGNTVTGTVTFTNNGPSAAANVTRTVALAGGTLTAVSGTGTIVAGSLTATFNIGNMPAGATATFTFTYVLPSAGSVSLTATITTTTADSTTSNNISTATTIVGSLADVSASLSLPATATANATVAGTVTFYNVGGTQANNVTRTVVLFGGTLTSVSGGTIATGSVTATFNVANMPAGSSASFTFTYVVPATGKVSATASIATSTTETVTTNNVATAVTLVGTAPDLSVSLSVSPNLLVAGTNTVRITVSNLSGMATTGTLTVTLPGGATVGFTITSLLSAGQTTSFSTIYSLPLLTSAAQTFSAIVTATSGVDSNLANNTTTLVATVGATLRGIAWIDSNRDRIYQAGEAILPKLLVRLYNAGSVVIGTAFTGSDGRYEVKGVPAGAGYRVEFANCSNPTAPSDCSAISTTPLNQTNTTIGGNPSTGVTTATTSQVGATVGVAITGVTLYVGDNTVDQNLPLDPRGQVYDSVTRQPILGATVRLSGPAGFNPATHLIDLNGAGQVNNESTTDASGLYQFIFINAPPAGVYTLSMISAPAGYLTAPAVLGGVSQPNIIANVATATFVVPSAATNMQAGYASPGTPPVGVNGSAALNAAGTQYVTTMSFAFGGGYIGELFNNNWPLDAVAGGGGGGVTAIDLSIVKSGPALMLAGGTGTYTLQIINPGPTAAANATVTDNMPTGLTLLSATVFPANAMALTVTPAGLVATTSSLAAGITTITLVVRAEASAVGTTVTNVASVATTTTESTTVNNTSSAATFVQGIDLSIVKSGPASLVAGGTASYLLTVVNPGPSAAANVTVTDVMPTGLSLLSASVLSGSLSLVTSAAQLTASALSLPAGTALIALTVSVDDNVVGTITNVARVTSTTADQRPSNNIGTATAGVLGADLGIVKTGAPSISAASTATYTLVLVNYGPSSAGNVTVTDVMPAGLTLLSAVAGGTSMTLVITPQQLVATAPVLRTGSTVTFTLTVLVDYTATGTITNIATVTSTTPDPTATNNIGSATSVVKEVESGVILVNKTGNKTVAEVGDSVQYTIRMRNTVAVPVTRIQLEDLLPAGFRYIPGTSRLNGTTTADPAGGIGRQLVYDIGTIPGNTVFELSYFVRLGVGSQQGDGINRATAIFPGARGTPVRSNTALFKVVVQGGVFSNEGCIVGKVYMDCDGNSTQNSEGGSRELGIPGVRLVMLDGSFIVTDNEGKYSLCGVKPQTHVIRVDRATLPRGARLLPSSNRNAGVGDSLFVEMRGGELHRADFIEGSCSPEVLEQVKSRRGQSGVILPEPDRVLAPQVPGSSSGSVAPAPPGGVSR